MKWEEGGACGWPMALASNEWRRPSEKCTVGYLAQGVNQILSTPDPKVRWDCFQTSIAARLDSSKPPGSPLKPFFFFWIPDLNWRRLIIRSSTATRVSGTNANDSAVESIRQLAVGEIAKGAFLLPNCEIKTRLERTKKTK